MVDLYETYVRTDLLREQVINLIKSQEMSVPGACHVLGWNPVKMAWIFNRLIGSGHLVKIHQKRMCPIKKKKYFIVKATGLSFKPKSVDDVFNYLSVKSKRSKRKNKDETSESEIINHPNGRVIKMLDRKASEFSYQSKKQKTVFGIGSSFSLMENYA